MADNIQKKIEIENLIFDPVHKKMTACDGMFFIVSCNSVPFSTLLQAHQDMLDRLIEPLKPDSLNNYNIIQAILFWFFDSPLTFYNHWKDSFFFGNVSHPLFLFSKNEKYRIFFKNGEIYFPLTHMYDSIDESIYRSDVNPKES